MKYTTPFMWRKGLILSATFLLAAFAIVSCKKNDNVIGQGTLNQNDILTSGGIDTFSLTTFSFVDDSIISDNALYGLLGSYNDPVFGTTNAEIYTQLRLPAFTPSLDFGDLSLISSIDSFVLALEYSGFYGNTGSQTVEVYEIDDPNIMSLDSVYYSSSTLSNNGINLVDPAFSTLDFNTSNLTIIGDDTVDSQLRIHLDTNWARNFIDDTQLSSADFESADAFANYFKGFVIKTNNGPQASDEGGVFYFNLNDALSKATIFYTQDGVKRTVDLRINQDAADFNHVEVNNTGTSVQTVIDDTLSGQVEFYAQAFGSRAVVQIPGLDNIPPNAVVHKATLELPVQHQSGTTLHPGGTISIATRENIGDDDFSIVPTAGFYSESRKRFEVDIRNHIQNIINGDIKNTELIISPFLFITSADRIIFNGSESTNKEKPRLTILYTEF